MRWLVDFLSSAGRLKKIKRRGALLYGKREDEVESTAEHTFRLVLMAWVLARERGKLDIQRVLKMALVHDLCEAFAGDITPYDGLLPKDARKRRLFVRSWPGLTQAERAERYQNKYRQEREGLERLLAALDSSLKKEIFDLWLDFEEGRTAEARFVKQVDRLENLLQAVEYYEEDEAFPTRPWWAHAKEAIDDPVLVQFMEALEAREHRFVALQAQRGKRKAVAAKRRPRK